VTPRIRRATADDEAALLAMADRMADFAVPRWRAPSEIIEADGRDVVRAAVAGEPDHDVFVAEVAGAPAGCLYVLLSVMRGLVFQNQILHNCFSPSIVQKMWPTSRVPVWDWLSQKNLLGCTGVRLMLRAKKTRGRHLLFDFRINNPVEVD
jgi:hypothetical protein